MKSNRTIESYVAFLRGINVGGHHKVPMAELKKQMKKLGFQNIETALNTGNVLFDSSTEELKVLEEKISEHLKKVFGFNVPTLIRNASNIDEMLFTDPFKDIEVTKDIRLYVSLLRDENKSELPIPWSSDDGSFRIIDRINQTIFSVLDLSVNQSPSAMEALEKSYGKDITTRNWNTILRIKKKLRPQG